MKLPEIRNKALTRYGIRGAGAEDPLWGYPLLTDLTNEAYRWLIRRTKALRELKTASLTASQAYVALGPTVFEFHPQTVRVQVSGEWRLLVHRPEELLVREYGPPETWSTGDPLYYYSDTANTAGEHRRLYLYPPPASDGANGLRYDAWVYPEPLVREEDAPVLPEAEHDYLLPAVCWRMALTEQGRGRQDAPVASWLSLAEQGANDLKSLLNQLRQPGPRRVGVDDWDNYDY